jgi:hypothetical protein
MFRPGLSHSMAPLPVLLTTASLYGRWATFLRQTKFPGERVLILVLPRANPRVRERLLAIGHSVGARNGRIRFVEESEGEEDRAPRIPA